MIKKLLLGILMVMVMCGSAMAGVVPTGDCGEFGCPPDTTGQFSMQDLGEFVGGAWVWADDFVQAADGQFSWANPNWQEAWKPFIEAGGFETDMYLMKRAYVNKAPDSRVQVHAYNKGSDIKIPIFWGAGCMQQVDVGDDPEFPQWESQPIDCPEVYDPAIQYNFMMACNPCGTGDPTNGIPGTDGIDYQVVESTPTESIDVQSVEWDGVFAEQVPYAVTPVYNMMKYDMGDSKMWHSVDIFEDIAVTYWHFPNKVPTAIGPTVFNITLVNGTTYQHSINVTSIDDLPTISAFTDSVNFIKVRPNGKVVAKTKTFSNSDVLVQNIVIREIDDPDGTGKALVIQWPVPDEVLFGGKYRNETYQLRVLVWKEDLEKNFERTLFIDCPAHVGTVVADAENYNWLKNELTANGVSLDDIQVTLMYRTISPDKSYYNRGYSDPISFTPVQ